MPYYMHEYKRNYFMTKHFVLGGLPMKGQKIQRAQFHVYVGGQVWDWQIWANILTGFKFVAGKIARKMV